MPIDRSRERLTVGDAAMLSYLVDLAVTRMVRWLEDRHGVTGLADRLDWSSQDILLAACEGDCEAFARIQIHAGLAPVAMPD